MVVSVVAPTKSKTGQTRPPGRRSMFSKRQLTVCGDARRRDPPAHRVRIEREFQPLIHVLHSNTRVGRGAPIAGSFLAGKLDENSVALSCDSDPTIRRQRSSL
jgi:hypothetical protein